MEKEEEPELELSADEQAVVEKVTRAPNILCSGGWHFICEFLTSLTLLASF